MIIWPILHLYQYNFNFSLIMANNWITFNKKINRTPCPWPHQCHDHQDRTSTKVIMNHMSFAKRHIISNQIPMSVRPYEFIGRLFLPTKWTTPCPLRLAHKNAPISLQRSQAILSAISSQLTYQDSPDCWIHKCASIVIAAIMCRHNVDYKLYGPC